MAPCLRHAQLLIAPDQPIIHRYILNIILNSSPFYIHLDPQPCHSLSYHACCSVQVSVWSLVTWCETRAISVCRRSMRPWMCIAICTASDTLCHLFVYLFLVSWPVCLHPIPRGPTVIRIDRSWLSPCWYAWHSIHDNPYPCVSFSSPVCVWNRYYPHRQRVLRCMLCLFLVPSNARFPCTY